jgi:hypothetical protein
MSFYEKGPVRIRYEEAGSGFPLLIIPGGGLNSTISGLMRGRPSFILLHFYPFEHLVFPQQLCRNYS